MFLPEPELSSDIEWLLQGTQDSPAIFVETLCREYGPTVYRLANALLGTLHAGNAVQLTLLDAYLQRRRYRPGQGPRLWVLGLALKTIRRLEKRVARRPTWLEGLSRRRANTAALQALAGLTTEETAAITGGRPQPNDPELAAFLQNHHPLPTSDHPEINLACATAIRQAGSEGERLRSNIQLQQGILAAVIVLIVLVSGLLIRRPSQVTGPRITRVVVTQVITVQVTRTPVAPTPTPTQPVSLVFNTTAETIRQRMFTTRTLWNSAFVEAQIVRYGPAGYIGPPRIYRNQLWVENPVNGEVSGRMVVLSGSAVEPARAIRVDEGEAYEIDLASGKAYRRAASQPENPFLPGALQTILMGDDVLWASDIMEGTVLLHMLSGMALASAAGDLEMIYFDRMLDRDVLVVERRLEGTPHERFWVDALNGMVLRWERYGGSDRVITDEIQLTQLELEAALPDLSLASPDLQRVPLDWNAIRRGSTPGRSFANLNNPRPRLEGLPPAPDGFDPAIEGLTLQWSLLDRRGLLPGPQAEILAGAYSLGTLAFGDPWNLACQRSPDGRRLVFVNPLGGDPGAFYADSGPTWIDLANPEELHNALPNAETVSRDFAISPDSTRLAFWGCAATPDNCGIYVHTFETRKNVKYGDDTTAALDFRWSPDGRQLAFTGWRPVAGQAGYSQVHLVILDVASGVSVYDVALEYPFDIPVGAPVRQWSSYTFPASLGLAACLEAPRP